MPFPPVCQLQHSVRLERGQAPGDLCFSDLRRFGLIRMLAPEAIEIFGAAKVAGLQTHQPQFEPGGVLRFWMSRAATEKTLGIR
ncbi:MAG TPA: hypothetical protein VFV87_00400 [Pirellulaceae bacterium]|nr:hypothetical protein [Pirellulaceae bacterium]